MVIYAEVTFAAVIVGTVLPGLVRGYPHTNC
jgi:hypothetical protein